MRRYCCPVCNEFFVTLRLTGKFCSGKCRQKAYNRRKKEETPAALIADPPPPKGGVKPSIAGVTADDRETKPFHTSKQGLPAEQRHAHKGGRS